MDYWVFQQASSASFPEMLPLCPYVTPAAYRRMTQVGDTLRINTIGGAEGGLLTDWEYVTIEAANGSEMTASSTISAATGVYYAEYGDFYSGPEEDYGVSTNCLQADPDFTNNPLDHDVSSSDLQDELQGLAQVNSSAGCLEVYLNKNMFSGHV